MSTISSSMSSGGSAWSELTASRAASRKERMFAKADTNGDGTVDQTELQNMLDNIASKTGQSLGSASDLMSSMDTDGSGGLSADELADGMKSLMPPPSSTMAFAQQRSGDAAGATDSDGSAANSLFGSLDADGSGGLSATELNKLLDQIASDTSASTGTSDATTGTSNGSGATDGVTAAAEAAVFKQLDTDGDGTISQAEFANAVAGADGGPPPGMPMDGMPPPPPPSDASGTSSDGSSSSTGTDPLDTNGDGVVSASELAAGQLKELVSNLSSALESSSTGTISASQADAFKTQLDSVIGSLQSAGSSSSASDGGSTSSSSQDPSGGLDLSALADLVMKEYGKAATNAAQGSSLSVAA